MLYEPNTIDWKTGDVVIHDTDAKKKHMLMRVIKVQKNGLIVTKYITPPSYDKRNRWKNDKKFLHDPARFGIQTGHLKVTDKSV